MNRGNLDKLEKAARNQKKSSNRGHGGRRHGSGRKPGVKSQATLDRLAARKYMLKRIAESVDPLLNALLAKAWGESYLMCRIIKGKGSKRTTTVEVVTSTETIKEYLLDDGATLNARGQSGDEEKEYYYISQKPSDTRAITNMFDRAFGRPTEKIEFGEKDEEDLSDLTDENLDDEIKRIERKLQKKV